MKMTISEKMCDCFNQQDQKKVINMIKLTANYIASMFKSLYVSISPPLVSPTGNANKCSVRLRKPGYKLKLFEV